MGLSGIGWGFCFRLWWRSGCPVGRSGIAVFGFRWFFLLFFCLRSHIGSGFRFLCCLSAVSVPRICYMFFCISVCRRGRSGLGCGRWYRRRSGSLLPRFFSVVFFRQDFLLDSSVFVVYESGDSSVFPLDSAQAVLGVVMVSGGGSVYVCDTGQVSGFVVFVGGFCIVFTAGLFYQHFP